MTGTRKSLRQDPHLLYWFLVHHVTRRLWNFTLGGEPVRVSSGFRYLGVELQQDVEVGIARPVAEARRTAVLARVA